MSPTWGQAVLVSAATRRSRGSAPLCAHSPSGCTFWGKRPWSRTRRILWQLGMVLGAPMVISLAAGVAVPVITIGIPIYMGRKVLAAVVLLPAEPGSPWLLAWTDLQCSLLPSAHPCATPALPGPSAAPSSPCQCRCAQPGEWVRVGERRKGSRWALQEHLCCGGGAVVAACPWGEGGVAVAGALPGWEGSESLGLCLCSALHFSVLSPRCWARAGGAASPGASSASLSPAVSSCLSLCPPS